jgi:spore germination protein GerM
MPLVLTLLTGACGVRAQERPTRLDDNDVRVAAPSTTTTRPAGVLTQPVGLCLIADDHLVVSFTDVPTPVSASDALEALIETSRTALPDGTRSAINAADLFTPRATQHGVAHVDLDAKFLEILPADQILAIAQIVCTLTGLPGIGQVRFTQEGRPTDVPRSDSSLTDKPVSRDDYLALLPPS